MTTKKILLRQKPAQMLLLLREPNKTWNVSSLSKAAGLSYVHATKLLRALEQAGAVSTRPTGRAKEVRLTEKGAEIAHALDDLVKKLEPPQEKQEKTETKEPQNQPKQP